MATKSNNSIKNFFQDNLNDKHAYVSCSGLLVQGTVEQKCHLKMSEFYGLECYINLNFNQIDVKELIRIKLLELREDKGEQRFGFDVFGELHNGLSDLIKNTEVKVASIYYKDVVDMKVTYYEGEIHTCTLKYKDDSIIKIECIS